MEPTVRIMFLCREAQEIAPGDWITRGPAFRVSVRGERSAPTTILCFVQLTGVEGPNTIQLKVVRSPMNVDDAFEELARTDPIESTAPPGRDVGTFAVPVKLPGVSAGWYRIVLIFNGKELHEFEFQVTNLGAA